MRFTRRSALASLVAVLSVSAARARSRPILAVTGRTRSGTDEAWTRADLEAVSVDALETTTPWHPGIQHFNGVRLSRLIERVGADGITAVKVHALNDYTAAVPIDDVRRYDPLLALRRNGADMPVADKGPLFLVYPFALHPELDSPAFRARSVWQIDAVELR